MSVHQTSGTGTQPAFLAARLFAAATLLESVDKWPRGMHEAYQFTAPDVIAPIKPVYEFMESRLTAPQGCDGIQGK